MQLYVNIHVCITRLKKCFLFLNMLSARVNIFESVKEGYLLLKKVCPKRIQ